MKTKLVLLIFIFKNLLVIYGYREFDVDNEKTILSLANETVNLQCKTDMQMAYCGFTHPNGKRYRFSGSELINGHCSIKINATEEDSGEWHCHIGRKPVGVEMKQKIILRVVSQVAAVQQNVTVRHGKEITLLCVTSKALTPISYCRFEPPNGDPFGIDSNVNASKAILGRYYFPSNKSLDRGDCAVTIRKVKHEDMGQWSCGAGLDDGQEYTDLINLNVEGLYISTASVNGIIYGVLGVILFLVILGLVAWKKRHVLGSRRSPEIIEVQELGPVARSERRHSACSRSTPRHSPVSSRAVPSVVIQSPSETSTSLRMM